MRRCNSQYHIGKRAIIETLFISKYHKNICKDCMSVIRKKERTKNKERCRREQKEWRKHNAEHVKKKSKVYRNSEHGKKVRQMSYERNRKQKRAYDKNRRQNEPGVREKYNAANAKYRAAKLQATTSWFEIQKEQIELLYKEASRLTKETGNLYHVDHKDPLQGKTICGLHCLENLQVITALENWKKKNKQVN